MFNNRVGFFVGEFDCIEKVRILMKVNVLVVDDCQSDAEKAQRALFLTNRLDELANVDFDVETFSNPEGAIESKKKFHFALIDVEMPEMNGFELAAELNKKQPRCLIIFLTRYLERAPEGYLVRTHRYASKPIRQAEIDEAVVSAVSEFRSLGSIGVKKNTKEIELELEDILYFKSFGNESIVCDVEGVEFECKMKLKQIEAQVPDWLFFKCHKQCLINMEYFDSWAKAERLIVLKSEDATREVRVAARNVSKVENARQLYYVNKGRR